MTRYELYSTGSNSHGQLGLASEQDHSVYTRIALPPNCKPLQLALGANHSLLVAEVDARKILLGSGSNQAGQLGRGDETLRLSFEEIRWDQFVPDDLADESEDDYTIEGVASSWGTSFIHLRPSGSEEEDEETRIGETRSDILVSCGSNDWGERGVGEGRRPNPTVVSFAHIVNGPYRISRLVAGPRHILALLEPLPSKAISTPAPILVGWGASRHGQLGSSDSASKLPRITSIPQNVPLPSPFSANDIIDFSCGKDHSAVLLHPHTIASPAEPSLLVLGSNKHGQLGPINSSSSSSAPRSNLLPLSQLTKSISDSPSSLSSTTVHTTWNSTFLTLPSSLPPYDSTATPLSTSSIIAFGSNPHGQLGQGGTIALDSINVTPTDLRILDFHSVSLARSSHPSFSPMSTSLRLCVGSEHLLALFDSSTSQQLYTWGWNEHGNLGLGEGDLLDRREPVRVQGIERILREQGGRIEGIWAGMATSWVAISYEEEKDETGDE
ncbi:hypothetical protein JCM5353_003245 [Sporobolomyces roseus]